MSVQPPISTIPCKILYPLANPVLPFLMFSSPFASPSAPRSTASYQKIARPIISPATPLESTLPTPPASVHSKPLTVTRFPLESTLTKKPGGRGPVIVNQMTADRFAPANSAKAPASIRRAASKPDRFAPPGSLALARPQGKDPGMQPMEVVGADSVPITVYSEVMSPTIALKGSDDRLSRVDAGKD
jgi:hypothetical protein